MDISFLEILKLLGNMGGLAVFSWALYKLHIKSLDDHKQEMGEERKLFKEESAAQRQLFEEQMSAERAMCQEHHREQLAVTDSILQTLTSLEARAK